MPSCTRDSGQPNARQGTRALLVSCAPCWPAAVCALARCVRGRSASEQWGLGQALGSAAMTCGGMLATVARCHVRGCNEHCARAPCHAPVCGAVRQNHTFLRCTRRCGSGVNGTSRAHAAGATRPGTMWGRTNLPSHVGWPCAGTGAVRACDLGRILAIFDAKG